MKRVKGYAIRHQSEGIIASDIFAHVPTHEEIAEVCKQTGVEERHGTHHPKTKEPHWVRFQEVVIHVPDEVAAAFEAAPPVVPRPPPGEGKPGEANVGFSSPKVTGRGHITNPADQTPEQAAEAAATRARRAAERGRETETITPADVGTVSAADLAK